MHGHKFLLEFFYADVKDNFFIVKTTKCNNKITSLIETHVLNWSQIFFT